MSPKHSTDSPVTHHRKKHWTVEKFAKMIWREHGFDTMMDETLINLWVNPTRRFLDEDYRLVLTFGGPPADAYWDILISPNANFFSVLEPFDHSLPDDQRVPLEFEHLNRFHAKYGFDFESFWSNDRPSIV